MVVNAVGAMVKSYPLPVIIIDMGTATSISVINQKGEYIGGVIMPGLNSALNHLAVRTSQLPKKSVWKLLNMQLERIRLHVCKAVLFMERLPCWMVW